MGTKMHKMKLYVVDLNDEGLDEIVSRIEEVLDESGLCKMGSVKTRDIGEWEDGNPMNLGASTEKDFKKAFKAARPVDEDEDVGTLIHKLEIYVVDLNGEGLDEITTRLEEALDDMSCPNKAGSVKTRDIGEWEDGNPMNLTSSGEEVFQKAFEEARPVEKEGRPKVV